MARALPIPGQLPLERKRPLARCSLCHRPLRTKTSIRRGMGPVCARRGEQGRLPLPDPSTPTERT